MNENVAKVIVRIYSVLSWISGIGYFLLGLFVILFNKGLSFGFNNIVFSRTAFNVIGIIMIIIGVLIVLLGIGLWRLRNWARITGIVLLSIGVLASLVALISYISASGAILGPLLAIIIDGVFLYFLAFDKAVFKVCNSISKK
jgi:hypothetical protein